MAETGLMWPALVSLSMTLIAAVACTDTRLSPALQVTSTDAGISENNVLVAEIGVSLNIPARIFIEYSNSDAGIFRTPTTETVAAEHTVRVVRLRSEAAYDYTVYTIDGEGIETAHTGGAFDTGALPEFLANLQFDVMGAPTPELVLMDLLNRGVPSWFIALDRDAEIVWYYQVPELSPGLFPITAGVKQKDNFNLVYTAGVPPNSCLREITPFGEQVDELVASSFNRMPHHDFVLLSDHEILYPAAVSHTFDDTPNGGPGEQGVMIESLRIWDQRTGSTREVWNSLDYWDPADPDEREEWSPNSSFGWVHGNSLTIGPNGNYILSSRNRNQVISIAPDFSEVEWVLGLGNDDSPASDFVWEDPNDRFYRQHSATQLPNGNILLFDNGANRPVEEGGQYSRALEIAMDGNDGVARSVWEYRTEDDAFASIISSAWRLDNGNTLVNFGIRNDISVEPLVAVEVTPDAEEIWHLDMMTGGTRFRVYGIDSLSGETSMTN